MERRDYDPGSRFEDEGIPDLQDGTPEQQRAVDPQELPLPGDEPVAVDEYGTTADEQASGEPLDVRLAREEPEEAVDPIQPRDPDESWDAAGDAAGTDPMGVGRLVAAD